MLQELSAFTPGTTRPRVALLIDGDNISHEQAGRILTRAGKYGDTVIRRVYGNATHLPGWNVAPGFHFRHAGSGKNASDMHLAVEAMDLMLTARADVLVVASSDRDFSHLATLLREQGRSVVGIGEAKACEAFRKTCTTFVELPSASAVAAPPAKQTNFEQKVISLVRKEDPPGLTIALLSTRMQAAHKLKISDEGEKNWRTWLVARPALFDCDPRGPQARVRLKA